MELSRIGDGDTQCGWEQVQRPPNSLRSAVPRSAEADLPADGTALLHCVPARRRGCISGWTYVTLCTHTHVLPRARQNQAKLPHFSPSEAARSTDACMHECRWHPWELQHLKAAATREDVAPVDPWQQHSKQMGAD